MSPLLVGIAGLGAMGSLTALELARRGHRVLGFDRFRPPHDQGSSHGKSRIIREAYFEHPQYVPLVQRAYQLWHALEQATGRRLYLPTGGLMIGPPGGLLVSGARTSAVTHGLPYEEMPGGEVRRRFPLLEPGGSEVGLFEPRAGVLFPEPAIEAVLGLAGSAGAELHFEEPVESWSSGPPLAVRTPRGAYQLDRLVLSVGAWLGTGLASRPLPLTITRQPLFWFGVARPALEAARSLPVFIWEWEPGRMLYGFPDLGEGVKVAIHHEGEPVDPRVPRRPAGAEEGRELARVLSSRIPALETISRTAVCLYTNTPSGDFLIDRDPGNPAVVLASPCSGHGFKFAPVVGEVIADLIEDRAPRFDLTPFGLESATRGSRGLQR